MAAMMESMSTPCEARNWPAIFLLFLLILSPRVALSAAAGSLLGGIYAGCSASILRTTGQSMTPTCNGSGGLQALLALYPLYGAAMQPARASRWNAC
ncbi:hypothetical protein FH972_023465 [Carpinus fangiana]|uniref:Uncharacterized protein n=1 Tax=Carpinus fangiana TaxID=176857 RepID=A0A5N6KVR3_9ROSI|nr:hypothetical protein FH972_023465 [Carpinus fangiana]